MRTSISIAVMGLIALAFPAAHAETGAVPAITPESIHIQRCSACHYVEGQSPGPEFPNIAGQYEGYLKKALTQFKENRRESDAMELIASLHKQQELVILANYYASQEPASTPSTGTQDPSLKARGEQLYKAERVYGIACADCHGADARGYVRASPRSSAVRAIPRLAGQRPAYLQAVIQKYREGSVGHGMCAMRKAGRTLSPDDVQALVEYLASK
jgi:cytochrome c553